MCDSVVELVAKLFKAGYTPEGGGDGAEVAGSGA